MHREVGSPVDHGLLDLRDEQALSADGRERTAVPVAARLDGFDGDLEGRVRVAQGLGDAFGLSEREG